MWDEWRLLTTYITQLWLSSRRRHFSTQKRRTFNELTQFRTSPPSSDAHTDLLRRKLAQPSDTRFVKHFQCNSKRQSKNMRSLTHSNRKFLICIKSFSHFVTHTIFELIERESFNYYCLHDFSTGTEKSTEPLSHYVPRSLDHIVSMISRPKKFHCSIRCGAAELCFFLSNIEQIGNNCSTILRYKWMMPYDDFCGRYVFFIKCLNVRLNSALNDMCAVWVPERFSWMFIVRISTWFFRIAKTMAWIFFFFVSYVLLFSQSVIVNGPFTETLEHFWLI